MCDIVCPEETVYSTIERILSSSTVGRSEIDVDFAVYPTFEESKY